jgi:hypothetical protein
LAEDLGLNAAGVKIALRLVDEFDAPDAALRRQPRDAVVTPSRATSDGPCASEEA